jgi:hypothetical protein
MSKEGGAPCVFFKVRILTFLRRAGALNRGDAKPRPSYATARRVVGYQRGGISTDCCLQNHLIVRVVNLGPTGLEG